MPYRLKLIVAAGAMAGVVAGTAGCSASIGQKTVSKDDVASQISSKVNDQSGQKPDSVSCPDDLNATVGATLNCALKEGGQTYVVNVTVTSVDGDTANFDIVETLDKDEVAKKISDQLSEQFGGEVKVTCPDNLKGAVGATLRCAIKDGGDTYGVSVTVLSVGGGDIEYNY